MGKRSARFWGARATLSLLLAFTAALALQLVQPARPVGATHYRSMQLTWTKDQVTPRKANFKATISARRSFYSNPNVGDNVNIVNIAWGDGTTSSTATFVVTSVDTTNDYLIAEKSDSHTYASDGPFTPSIQAGNRLSAPQHRNNPDGQIHIATLVNFTNGGSGSGSVSSSLPPIVDCPRTTACSFYIPATDPDGSALYYRFATSTEMAGSGNTAIQPKYATVNTLTGLYTWDTPQLVAADLNPNGASYYSTQVIVEKRNSSNTILSYVAVDFFLRLSDVTSADTAPEWHSPPTPQDGDAFNVAVGSTLTFNTEAHDNDTGDAVTLGVLGLPVGATYTTSSSGAGYRQGIFSWTPSGVGSYIVTLTATDNQGLGATQRSVTINVGDETELVVQPTTAQSGGSATVSATLRYKNGGAAIPNKGVTFTVGSNNCSGTTDSNGVAFCTISTSGVPNGTYPNGLSAGFNGGGGLFAASGSASITVGKLSQAITFAALANKTFGDAPFAVGATSDSGLPVSFGASGACTVSGSTVTLTGVGSCTVSADQAGDASYDPATTVSQSFSVAKGDQTIAFPTPGPQTYGTNVTLPATSSAGLPITYTVSGNCTVIGNALTFTGAGSCTVTASQSGDMNYNAATAVTQTFGIAKLAPAITWPVPAPITQGTPLGGTQLNATVGNIPGTSTPIGGTFVYNPSAGVVLGAGANVLSVSFVPDDTTNFTSSTAQVPIQVNGGNSNIAFAPLANKTYGDAPFAVSATSTSPEAITFGAAGACTVGGNVVTITGAGSCAVTASQPRAAATRPPAPARPSASPSSRRSSPGRTRRRSPRARRSAAPS